MEEAGYVIRNNLPAQPSTSKGDDPTASSSARENRDPRYSRFDKQIDNKLDSSDEDSLTIIQRQDTMSKATRDPKQREHINFFYGLLDSPIQKLIDPELINTLDQLIYNARTLQNTLKKCLSSTIGLIPSCVYHEVENNQMLHLINQEKANRDPELVGQQSFHSLGYPECFKNCLGPTDNGTRGFFGDESVSNYEILLPLEIFGETGTAYVSMSRDSNRAGHSLIDVFRRNKTPMNPYSLIATYVNPNLRALDCHYVNVPVKLSNRVFHTIFMLTTSRDETVLGIDFIRSAGLVIDIDNNVFYFSDESEQKFPILKKAAPFRFKKETKIEKETTT